MRVSFLIPSRTHIPSGIVRVLQYADFLRGMGVQFRVFQYQSPYALGCLRLHERWRGVKGPFGKIVRHTLSHLSHGLDRLHWRYEKTPLLREAARCDLLFIQWVLPPRDFLEAALERSRIIYDFDDALFLKEPEGSEFMIRNAAAVIAGSHFNYDFASRLNSQSFLVPSPVPLERFQAPSLSFYGPSKPVRIGWVGSVSTVKYLRHLAEPMSRLAEEGYDLKLVVAGTWGVPDAIPKMEGIQVEELPTYDANSLPELVSSFDIGVMPVDDTPWERGKCAMKALLYMAAGKPSVSSPVGEINHIVKDGFNGCLASGVCEWTVRLKGLIDSPEERLRIGMNARRTVEEGYSTDVCSRQLYDIIRKVGTASP